MIRPLVTTVDEPADRSPLIVFGTIQLLLLAAIPMLSWVGANAVLQSRAGQFVEEPLPGQPGWIADVDPTPTALALAVDDGVVVGGVVVTALGSDTVGGTLVLLPPSTPVGDTTLGSLSPVRAGPELAAELGWTFREIDVLDAVVWEQALGTRFVTVDNPDPVLGADGTLAFAVGTVELGGADIGPYLAGSLEVGAGGEPSRPGAEVFRHRLFWRELMAVGLERPTAVGPVLAAALDEVAVAEGTSVLIDLPADADEREAFWRTTLGVLPPSDRHPAIELALPAGDESFLETALTEMTYAGLAVIRVEVEDRPAGDGVEVVSGADPDVAAEVATRLDAGTPVPAVDPAADEGEEALRSRAVPLVRLWLAAPSLG